MKSKILSLGALLLVSSGTLRAATEAQQKPNIIFVLFDDMGYGQPKCFRDGTEFKTPNIDRLAKEGMRFTDAHSAASVCTPTRYGIITGRYPSRIGQYGVLETYSAPIIPATRLTVASMMKQNGYDTICLNDLMATCAEIIGAKIPDNAAEDSVSILPDLLGTAKGAVREATIHQSPKGDLALRQGPWKLIFLKGGAHELYNLQTDLSETKDVAAANPEVVEKLTAMMKKYIADGRSTAGAAQKNEAPMSVDRGSGGVKKKGKKAGKESKEEITNALNPNFD